MKTRKEQQKENDRWESKTMTSIICANDFHDLICTISNTV